MNATEAPWWGVPVIAGIFLLLGGLAGYYFNLKSDARRFARDDALRSREEALSLDRRKREEERESKTRVLEDVKKLAVRVIEAIRIVHGEASVLNGSEPLAQTTEEKESSRALRQLIEKAIAEATSATTALALIAPSTIVTSSLEVSEAALRCYTSICSEIFDATRTALGAHNRAFVDEVRSYLDADLL